MLIRDLHSSKGLGCGGELNQSQYPNIGDTPHRQHGGYDLYCGTVIGCGRESSHQNAYI